MTNTILKDLIKHPVLIVLAAVLLFTAGYIVRGGNDAGETVVIDDHAHVESAATTWTCSMHPQIRQPKPGQCPLCGMDLVPVEDISSGAGSSPREIELSPEAVKLARIRTAKVERRAVEKEIRLPGVVAYDETRVAEITAWFPGRIDRLHVDFTGRSVSKGDRLADIYSPEIRMAWDELRQAEKAVLPVETASFNETRSMTSLAADAVRGKLRLLGMTDDHIDRFARGSTPPDHITVESTVDGVVIRKDAVEGMYADTGTALYTVADLSSVWVMLDVNESDIAWIKTGQKVTMTAEAWPGDAITGTVSFVDPTLNPKTRTVGVRVETPNADSRLRPEMFVRATVHVRGKTPDGRSDMLVIPSTAALVTGRRAVVYVAPHGRDGVYEGREVVLGHRFGDWYEVREGLAEGEAVVVEGAFRIDSALQITARPSMMSPEGKPAPEAHQHGNTDHDTTDSVDVPELTGAVPGRPVDGYESPEEFKVQLDGVHTASFAIHNALARDSLTGAKEAAKGLLKALDGVDMALLEHEPHMVWMKHLTALRNGASSIAGAGSLDGAREEFKTLSAALIAVVKDFGVSGHIGMYRFHCPMAFENKGADWLQGSNSLENPWFGSSMFKCGTLEETITEGGGASSSDSDGKR